MAKTYLSTIKYEIKATYEVDGIVEKPDIIGAIFGQSEGLLGEDMDLKELQQAGKLGRIEITVNKNKGKTSGEIIIPSSLDQVKTSILAATIETVEKVGPCNTIVKILNISDTRKEKRDVITDRAKQLLKKMQKFEGIETTEIADNIKSQIRTAKIVDLNGLQAGPEVQTSNEIIVVEGRADVIKLLSYGIKNAIAMNGSNIEQSLIELCKHKTVTMLVDGDRGGELNAKKLAALTKVEFVATAPDGKEVEELTQKEILQSLKRKYSIADYLKGKSNNYPSFERPQFNKFNNRPTTFKPYNNNYPTNKYNNYQGKPSYNQFGSNRNERFDNQRSSYNSWRPNNAKPFDPFQGNYRPKPSTQTKTEQPAKIETKTEIQKTDIKPQTKKIEAPTIAKTITNDYTKFKGSLKARLYDDKNKKIKDVEVKEIIPSIEKSKKKIHTILFDGIITKRLLETAEKKEINTIIGARKSSAKSEKVNTLTM
ncbi:MAG: DNA primase DnaG [Candidatus ainarchaeum sp.]|nr:DNA primase DnaG [Candidatus ainarchaeum sp.]